MPRRVSTVLLTAALLAACTRTGPVTKAPAKPKATSAPVAASATPGGEDVLSAPKGATTELAGVIALDAAYAVAEGAAKLISDNGGGLISDHGGGLIANNGSSLVANNGGNLVGHDPAQITSHLGAALTSKVKLISNNGGGIISDNGAGFRLLADAAPTHQALPVGGMLVGVQSLATGAFLPLGVDRAGKPVYAVYTDAKGSFKAHLPAGVGSNVLVVASFAGTKDPRLAVDLLAKPVSAAGLQVDDGTTVITTYLRRAMISRVEELVDPDPCLPPANTGSLSGSALALGIGLFQEQLASPAFKALPREARRRVLVRFTDAVLSALDVENAQIAPGLEPGSKATGAAVPSLKRSLRTLEAAAAERLTASPTYFDTASYVKLANLDRQGRPPVQIRKAADLSEFLVAEFLATSDLAVAERAQAMLVDLGLPTQLYLDITVAGASLMAAMGAVLSFEQNTKVVRDAIAAALADEAGAKAAADPVCPPAPTPPARAATPVLLAGTGKAGATDGPVAMAQFNAPTRLALDPAGSLYVSEAGGNRIRKLDLATKVVSTVAGSGTAGGQDGDAKAAQFDAPCGLALDGKGGLYVAERGGNRIRRIELATGQVSTVAGSGTAGFADGAGTAAQFKAPEDLAVGPDGALYVADTGNNRIRLVRPDGAVTTFAGNGDGSTLDGMGTEAATRAPRGIAFAPAGFLITADSHDEVVRKLTLGGGLSVLAGTQVRGSQDGTYWTATFDTPAGVAADAAGNLYVADTKPGAVRMLDAAGFVSTVATLGAGAAEGLAVGPDGTIYVADPKNHKLQTLKP